jgi:putative phosphotransacetylase
VRQVIDSMLGPSDEKLIPIGVSARHLHISQEHLEMLFGPGYQLTKLKDLNQPGEFAAKETVSLMGPKRQVFEKVRILGPTRPFTQVELSFTDGIYLGIDLPPRLSGNIKDSAPIIIIGPKGVLNLKEGAIRALRHIHINPEDAEKWGLKNGQKVSVTTRGPMSLSFNEVIVRIKEGLNLEMHLDTDEANAAGLHCGDQVGLLL